MSRRDWIRFIGVGAASLGVSCGDNVDEDTGAAIFDPTPDAFLLSVWSRSGGLIAVEIRDGDEVLGQMPLALGPGGCGAVDITGLAPDRSYDVFVSTGGANRRGPYRARTAPALTASRAVRIAVSADFDPSPEFESDLIDHLLAAQPELFVSLGDFPYTDNGPIAETVDEYRSRHVDLRMAPAARRLLEGVPIRAIYDDHEFRNDWDAGFAATEASRYAAAMQVWDEFFPVRGATGEVRYRSWRWGAHAECFLLDCRRFRSANSAPDDAQKTMLGATQLAWLIDAITRSTATFKIVFTSVPLAFGHGDDHWSAFTTERAVLLDAMVGIPGVVFVSADQHFFAAHEHAFGVREFQVGPLARGVIMPPPDVAGVRFRSPQLNVGLLDITADRLIVSGLGASGEVFFRDELTAEILTPR